MPKLPAYVFRRANGSYRYKRNVPKKLVGLIGKATLYRQLGESYAEAMRNLPQVHGFPARLLIPGHYGVANVKWLTQIHVQDRRYMGRFMGRDYVTLKKEMVGGEERWVENSVTKIQLKSAIVRVTRLGAQHKISGFVLTDGTPLRSVEIKIDDGPWREADLDSRSTRYSWKH